MVTRRFDVDHHVSSGQLGAHRLLDGVGGGVGLGEPGVRTQADDQVDEVLPPRPAARAPGAPRRPFEPFERAPDAASSAAEATRSINTSTDS